MNERNPRASVHPHVRGEHMTWPRRLYSFCGSPPRAWGTLKELGGGNFTFRFTPTCVGNITMEAGMVWVPAVHPHVRGEHEIENPIHHVHFRFTPTCVGNILDSTAFLR